MASLEQDFHNAMVALYEAQKEYGYNVAFFRRMLDEYGGVEAARRLLATHETQEGLFGSGNLIPSATRLRPTC